MQLRLNNCNPKFTASECRILWPSRVCVYLGGSDASVCDGGDGSGGGGNGGVVLEGEIVWSLPNREEPVFD